MECPPLSESISLSSHTTQTQILRMLFMLVYSASVEVTNLLVFNFKA